MTVHQDPPTTSALDEATRKALVDEVEAAKARGWTQIALRGWFASKGVDLSDYLAAKKGAAISAAAAGALAMVSITGLPDRPDEQSPDDEFSDIPARMKAARRWLVWRSEANSDPDKKPRKVPYYVTGERRQGALDTPEDVARLASYPEAVKALQGGFTGLGFALGRDGDGCWQGIDLDHLDSHPGLTFVAEDLPGYTERSPSGKGVHAIGYGRTFASLGSNATGIEAYAAGRYFTVTGESVGTADLTCLADFVERRLAPLHNPRPQDTSVESSGGSLAGSMAAQDLRSALASMRSDDRDLWIRMGHALKELGDQGRGLWLEWSQTSEKYDAADAARTWDSFKPERTGYQAVFAEAQRRGWANPGARTPTEALEFDPQTGEVLQDDDGPFQASEFHGQPPERLWIVKDWIVQGAVNSLYGDGGLGKTLLAQQLACAVSMGEAWLGLPTLKGSVMAVLCEDDKDELHRRHNEIKAAAGHAVGNPYESVWLWPRVGKENVLIRWGKDGQPVLGAFYASILAAVSRINPSLLILDTLADFYAGNEIDRPSVNYFVKTVLGGLIRSQQDAGHSLTILLLGHPSVAGKASGAGYSGSTAWNNAVRSRMYLSRPEEGSSDDRILTRGKANYAKSGDETALRLLYANGVLHACEDVDDGDSMLWAAKEEAVRLVEKAWASGRPYSAQKAHSRHVYRVLPEDMAKSGFGPQIVRQAIRELIEDEALVVSASNGKRGYRAAQGGR